MTPEFSDDPRNPAYRSEIDPQTPAEVQNLIMALPDTYEGLYSPFENALEIGLKEKNSFLFFNFNTDNISLYYYHEEYKDFGPFKDKLSTIKDSVLGVEQMLDFLIN